MISACKISSPILEQVKHLQSKVAMSKYFDEKYVDLVRRQIASIAKAMLANEISFLVGARRISLLRYAISLDNSDSDLLTFAMINTETEHLLLEKPYKSTDNQTVADIEGEIEASEIWARISGGPACESLMRRFSN